MNKQQALDRLSSLENEAKELRKIIEEPEQISKELRFWGIINGLTLKIDKVKYPDTIFLFKDDICYIEYNTKNGYLWLKYSTIWSILEKEYSLKYEEIQSFIMNQVEEHFNCRGVTPLGCMPALTSRVEEHFKNKK